MTEISIQNPRRYRSLQPAHLRAWLQRLLKELAPEASTLGVRLVDEREMQALNLNYRARDYATDVLSFPGEESPEGHHLGDLVISIPTSRRQAKESDVSEMYELKCLLLHGVLHCLGYDHETDAGEMDRLEARLKLRWVVDVD